MGRAADATMTIGFWKAQEADFVAGEVEESTAVTMIRVVVGGQHEPRGLTREVIRNGWKP